MIRRVKERPTGYRIMGKVLKRSEKGIQLDYYGWELWLPKKSVVKIVNGPYCAPDWAITSAKEFLNLKEKTS